MHKLLRIKYSQVENLPHVACFLSSVVHLSSNSSVRNNIPKRIERKPTDILQTLASTIKRDPTAPHYKYHDDPFLIPMSNVGKRTFAMAQEAGRKAAKWIVNENAQLFDQRLAEPPIEFFTPKLVYDEQSQVEENTLFNIIEAGNISDAIIIYGLLSQRGIEISEAAKMSMLELVCFSNEEDSVPEELIEERWFSHSKRTKSSDTIIKTWKDNGLAETLFMSLPKTASVYSVLIQGMAKFGQIEKAWQHFEVATEKGLALDVGAFNSLLSVVNSLKQGSDLRWQLLLDLLSRMATEKIEPNVFTLNAVLFTVSGIGGGNAIQYALSSLKEFQNLNVNPSLGSFYLILQTLSRDRNSTVDQGKVLSDILERLEGQSLNIQHPLDTRFFVKAMEVCRFSAQDADLAHRVDALLHYADNYNLIGDSYEESVYYRNFFILLCATETLENVMETYNALVPNIYTPEPSVMQELIKTANLSGDVQHLARFWTDMVAFDHADREPLIAQLLDALVRNEPEQSSPLVSTFADIAFQVWEKIENQPANRINVISWSGELLSNVMILSARNGDLQTAVKVMKKLCKEQSYLGEPLIEALCAYMDLCILKNDFKNALECLKHCKETGRAELVTMAKDLRTRLSLSEDQDQQISKLLTD